MYAANLSLVTTTLLSYIGCFLFVMGTSKLESRLRGLEQKTGDIESQPAGKHASTMSLAVSHTKRLSQMSQLTAVLVHHEPNSALDKICLQPSKLSLFLVKTLGFWASIFLFLTVGLPVSVATKYDMPLEAFCFICLWIASLLWQRSLKTCQVLGPYPQVRYLVVILFNPVLLTSALGTAYFWAKAAVTHQSIDEILGAFRCHDTWASIISVISQGQDAKRHIGAGDLATALLDAGIVSLGLKMFEYRQELWNSFNTVFSASLVFAIISLFLNVVFAHAMGLPAPEALAFAARNVTIALGVPEIRNLQGSTALMSALVVFSGMLYQMTGDLLLSWLSVPDRKHAPSADHVYAGAAAEKGVEDDSLPQGDNCRVIAAGVTVGINAAAMGTAHLIERDSRATAYSALSMTMFGSFTVALTAVPAISDVLMSLASR